MRLSNLFIFVCFLSAVCQAAESGTENFRIENELTVQQTGKKVTTTTLFSGGLVYDMIGDHGETTIFDKASDTFTLIEPALRIQTTVKASELKETVLLQRERMLSQSQSPFFSFAASPKFEETYEVAIGAIRFQSPWMDYQIETMPLSNDAIRLRYYDFCDWYCFLNLRVNPDSTTLFARMEVNRFLQERKRFPTRIQVDVFRKGNFGITGIVATPDVYIGTHQLGTRLIPSDEHRLQRLDEQRKTFRTVSFEEYLKETRQ